MKDKTTKQKVFELLEKNNMNFVSGQEIADTLFITRAGIWKAIKSLREEGYNIEAVTNRGYRLVVEKDVLSKSGIDENKRADIETFVFKEVESTNDVARNYALEGKEELVVIADYQTKGRGRRGRVFYSPKDSGLYLSFLLRPEVDITKATGYTCMAAVATCNAIKKATGKEVYIKWVNDIFYEDLKIAGILTEGFTSIEDGSLEYMIVGIGINLYTPPGGFPDELKKIAGALIPDGQTENNVRNRLCAALIDEFMNMYTTNLNFLEQYRELSYLKDKYVKVIPTGKEAVKGYARVISIEDDFSLLVEYENGKKENLSSGEVSVVKY